MKKYPKVLVSILHYNNINNTIETIELFEKQQYPNFDIQIIDNGSTDGCVAKLKKRVPNLKVIVLSNNVGYAGGNNVAFDIGVEKGYDYVLISNNDIALKKDFVSKSVKTSLDNPAAGIIGAIEKDYYTKKTRIVGGYGFKPYLGKGTWARSIEGKSSDVLEVDYVQGSLILFTRKALQSGIRFDEKLFLYCEEIDIQFQLRKNKLKALVPLNCTVYHKGMKQFNLLQGYYIQRNRIYLTKKHGNKWQYIIAILYTILFELPIKFVIRSIQGYPNYALFCCLGFIDGIKGKMYNKIIK